MVTEPKSWLVALLLSLVLGGLGVDRFYLGYTGLGIAKLLTGGGCVIGWIYDLVTIALNKLPDAQGNPLQK
jgi:TM2 domain-containing membrane protein YozV